MNLDWAGIEWTEWLSVIGVLLLSAAVALFTLLFVITHLWWPARLDAWSNRLAEQPVPDWLLVLYNVMLLDLAENRWLRLGLLLLLIYSTVRLFRRGVRRSRQQSES